MFRRVAPSKSIAHLAHGFPMILTAYVIRPMVTARNLAQNEYQPPVESALNARSGSRVAR